MSYIQFSSEQDEPIYADDNDNISRPAPVPFRLWSIFGGWRPVCVKHKLVFWTEKAWYDHYEPACAVKGSEYPPSDYLRKNKGYRRIWK